MITDFIKASYNINPTKTELYSLYDFLFDLINKSDFKGYESILDQIDIKLISNGLIVGLVRTPFIHRNKISNYDDFVKKSKQELFERGSINLLIGF